MLSPHNVSVRMQTTTSLQKIHYILMSLSTFFPHIEVESYSCWISRLSKDTTSKIASSTAKTLTFLPLWFDHRHF